MFLLRTPVLALFSATSDKCEVFFLKSDKLVVLSVLFCNIL